MSVDAGLERAKSLHQRALVFDAHSGLSTDVARRRLQGEREIMRRVHLPRLRQGGVDAVALSVGGDTISYNVFKTDRHLSAALARTEAMLQELDECSDEMAICTTAQEIRDATARGKVAFLLSLEGARPIEDQLDFLRLFHRLGVRRLQLTWNFRNNVADGCGEVNSHGGISEFGISVIKEINRLGMALDLAHISESSFWSALDHSKGPVIVSHANVWAVREHPRNLKDDQIKALAAREGFLGMTFYGQFISAEEPTVRKLVDHIDHVVNLIGIDHVGIGADYTDHASDLLGSGLSAFPGLYPKETWHTYPVGLSTYAETPNLTVELLRRGYSETDVHKILGENLLQALSKIVTPAFTDSIGVRT